MLPIVTLIFLSLIEDTAPTLPLAISSLYFSSAFSLSKTFDTTNLLFISKVN